MSTTGSGTGRCYPFLRSLIEQLLIKSASEHFLHTSELKMPSTWAQDAKHSLAIGVEKANWNSQRNTQLRRNREGWAGRPKCRKRVKHGGGSVIARADEVRVRQGGRLHLWGHAATTHLWLKTSETILKTPRADIGAGYCLLLNVYMSVELFTWTSCSFWIIPRWKLNLVIIDSLSLVYPCLCFPCSCLFCFMCISFLHLLSELIYIQNYIYVYIHSARCK